MLGTKFHAEHASFAAFVDNMNMTVFAFCSHNYFTNEERRVN